MLRCLWSCFLDWNHEFLKTSDNKQILAQSPFAQWISKFPWFPANLRQYFVCIKLLRQSEFSTVFNSKYSENFRKAERHEQKILKLCDSPKLIFTMFSNLFRTERRNFLLWETTICFVYRNPLKNQNFQKHQSLPTNIFNRTGNPGYVRSQNVVLA